MMPERDSCRLRPGVAMRKVRLFAEGDHRISKANLVLGVPLLVDVSRLGGLLVYLPSYRTVSRSYLIDHLSVFREGERPSFMKATIK